MTTPNLGRVYCRSRAETHLPRTPTRVPVRAERREREHGHADRGELDDGDEFARSLAEHPLLREVAEGVHGHAGDEQEQVPQRQAGDEDVGHAAHGAAADEDLHQRDVAQQPHGHDQDVDGSHDAAHRQVRRVGSVRGRPPAGLPCQVARVPERGRRGQKLHGGQEPSSVRKDAGRAEDPGEGRGKSR